MNIQYWNIIHKYNTIINLTQHHNDISCLDQKIFSIFFFKNRLFQDLNQQSHTSKSQITTDRPGSRPWSRPESSFRAFGPEKRCEVGAGCARRLRFFFSKKNQKKIVFFKLWTSRVTTASHKLLPTNPEVDPEVVFGPSARKSGARWVQDVLAD